METSGELRKHDHTSIHRHRLRPHRSSQFRLLQQVVVYINKTLQSLTNTLQV